MTRYVWQQGGWRAPPERIPLRRLSTRYVLPGHYWQHQWGFYVRRWLGADEIAWKDMTPAEQREASRPPAAFFSQVARGWQAYDRSAGAFIYEHATSESGHVRGVHRVVEGDRVAVRRYKPAVFS